MSSYPVIEQKSLPRAPRGGPWGIGFRARPASELPLPNAHEAVVYKSGNSYVVDNGRSRPTDAHIANATNISVVDIRENSPVTVHASIPSAGAGEFAVQVTFLCTVKSAEDVVDSGLKDMEEALTQYLAQHQPLFHIGENYEFDEVTTVRRNVTATVKAHVSVRPPRFRGMEVTLGNVQVLTPAELAKFESLRRERRREGLLTSEGQRQEHFLAQERQRHQQVMDVTKQRYEQELETQAERNNEQLAEMRRQLDESQELQKRRHEQLVAEMRQEFEQAREQRQLGHDQGLRSQKFDHAIAEAARLTDAIGADRTEVPSLLAATAGERTIAETADLLGQSRQAERDAEAVNSLRRETWDHEDRQARWQADREDGQVQWRADREDARMRYQIKIEELKAQLEIFSTGIARGLADAHTIDKLVGVIGGAVKKLESVSADVPMPGSPPSDSDQAAGEGSVYDAEVVTDPDSERGPEVSEHQPEADETIREGQVVSDGLSSHDHSQEPTDSEVREEDLGT